MIQLFVKHDPQSITLLKVVFSLLHIALTIQVR